MKNSQQAQTTENKQAVKRCPCKKIFESYLTDEQKAKLAQMREDKKKGISFCNCRRSPYY